MRTPKIMTSKNPRIEARRAKVLQWILSGFVYAGQILTLAEFAASMGVRPEVISHDIAKVRVAMARRIRTAPALHKVLLTTIVSVMEMIQQDRGRAIEQYERLRSDLYLPDGTRKAAAGKDYHELGYQMAAFLKLAQNASDQLIRLMSYMTSKSTGSAATNIYIDNSVNTSNNSITAADAVRLLETSQTPVAALPTRKKALPVYDIEAKYAD